MEQKKFNLSSLQKALVDNPEDIHCENLIGAISLPLGVAGPLYRKHMSPAYIPLATTEGALVASVQRGIKAMNESESVEAHVHSTGATRGPVFFTGSLRGSISLKNWLVKNESQIKKVIESTSSHLRFKKFEVKMTGPYVFVRFQCDTDEAMGMNMITIGVSKAVSFICAKTGYECLAVAGNFDIDKKPAWLNMNSSRGYEVWAEVTLSSSTVKSVLKTTPAKMFDTWLAKCMIGSALSGAIGFNAHYANIVAAFFAATGQDLGHVVEGSHGITTMYKKGTNLGVAIYMPAVMMGMVGGGTKLKTQTEARSLTGAIDKADLVKVLGMAVLAGEISLLAALAQGSLAKAHIKLGR